MFLVYCSFKSPTFSPPLLSLHRRFSSKIMPQLFFIVSLLFMISLVTFKATTFYSMIFILPLEKLIGNISNRTNFNFFLKLQPIDQFFLSKHSVLLKKARIFSSLKDPKHEAPTTFKKRDKKK